VDKAARSVNEQIYLPVSTFCSFRCLPRSGVIGQDQNTFKRDMLNIQTVLATSTLSDEFSSGNGG
jgi:hypothetical protein